jgi:hypothetical protein
MDASTLAASAHEPESEPAPLPNERVLEIVGESLTKLTGTPWELRDGPLLRGPGSAGVRLGAAHVDSFRHVDLEFLLNVDNPDETSLLNCASGLHQDPETAVRQAVEAWQASTAVVGFEMLTRRGEYATYLPPGSADGVPGWHAIIGSVVGWGLGDAPSAQQEWLATRHPWRELAPLLLTGLDRPYLNGIRIMVGGGGDFETAEVRINGRPHDAATAALLGMDWPRTAEMTVGHVFLLLVHPEQATSS